MWEKRRSGAGKYETLRFKVDREKIEGGYVNHDERQIQIKDTKSTHF